jgi:carbon storage regulator CsrA
LLVISRKKNEALIIKGKDGDIRIVLIEGERGRARLGIEAPKGYIILREELIAEVRDSNRMSALRDLASLKKIIGEGNG